MYVYLNLVNKVNSFKNSGLKGCRVPCAAVSTEAVGKVGAAPLRHSGWRACMRLRVRGAAVSAGHPPRQLDTETAVCLCGAGSASAHISCVENFTFSILYFFQKMKTYLVPFLSSSECRNSLW